MTDTEALQQAVLALHFYADTLHRLADDVDGAAATALKSEATLCHQARGLLKVMVKEGEPTRSYGGGLVSSMGVPATFEEA